jgi:A/G-specific adenine glycosylase
VSVKIVKNLCSWFARSARDLPWRRTRDPYRIWLSEIMLQQTRVATVIPYYERFLKEFPDVSALARASEDRVLGLWAGLGYYSRARNLHRGAGALSFRLSEGLGFPRNREEWLEVPGVGPYTAGAICSIAYNQPEALVDGNVVRVLSRIHAIEDPGPAKEAIWSRAGRLVRTPGAVPRELNQALMELGATLCTPARPACDDCPVRGACRGRSDPARYPLRKKRTELKRIHEKKWIVFRRRRGKREVLLFKNAKGGWRQGLWDFPDFSQVRIGSATLLEDFSIRYVVTRHRVERQHSLFLLDETGRVDSRDGRWFRLDEPPGVPAPVKKAIERIRRNFE